LARPSLSGTCTLHHSAGLSRRTRTPALSRAQQPQRGSWVRTRRSALRPVSSSSPLRTGRATFMASGSAPVIGLHGMPMKRRFPCRQFHRCPPVYSLRVHWVPLCPSSHRLGAFAVSAHPGVPSFPGCRLLCPIRLSMRALAFRWGLPYLLAHSPSHPSRSLPCSSWKTQAERWRWRVHLLAPTALCGSPGFGQRVGQVDLCHLCSRRRWALVPTRTARICFQAHLADITDKVCQGQPSPKGFTTLQGMHHVVP